MRSVNLLPAERRKERTSLKLTPFHGVALAIVVAGGGMFFYGHKLGGEVTAEKATVATIEQEEQTLKSRLEQAKSVAAVDTSGGYEADRGLVIGLAQARVNWANVAMSIARVSPKGVWLKSLTVETPTAGDQAAAATGTAGKPATAITLEGGATSRTQVAVLVSRLGAISGFGEPQIGGIEASEEGLTYTIEIPIDSRLTPLGAEAARTGATPSAASTTTPPSQP